MIGLRLEGGWQYLVVLLFYFVQFLIRSLHVFDLRAICISTCNMHSICLHRGICELQIVHGADPKHTYLQDIDLGLKYTDYP